jgi:tetratricopeptide (TPR) repeat protein
LIFIGGTSFALYRHLERNSYATLMEEARELYDRGEHPSALSVYQSAAKRYPSRVEPLLGMAYSAERAGRLGDALEAYRASLGLFADNAALSRGRVLYEVGRLYATLRAWDDARKSFEQAVEIDPTNQLTHFALGGVLEEQKEILPAFEAYKRALELSPSSEEARSAVERLARLVPEDKIPDAIKRQRSQHAAQVGSVALGLKRYDEALRYFNEALTLLSDDVTLWAKLSEARFGLGDVVGALKAVEVAAEKAPGRADLQSRLDELTGMLQKEPPKIGGKGSPLPL